MSSTSSVAPTQRARIVAVRPWSGHERGAVSGKENRICAISRRSCSLYLKSSSGRLRGPDDEPSNRGQNEVNQRVEVNKPDDERQNKIPGHVFFLPKEKIPIRNGQATRLPLNRQRSKPRSQESGQITPGQQHTAPRHLPCHRDDALEALSPDHEKGV